MTAINNIGQPEKKVSEKFQIIWKQFAKLLKFQKSVFVRTSEIIQVRFEKIFRYDLQQEQHCDIFVPMVPHANNQSPWKLRNIFFSANGTKVCIMVRSIFNQNLKEIRARSADITNVVDKEQISNTISSAENSQIFKIQIFKT